MLLNFLGIFFFRIFSHWTGLKIAFFNASLQPQNPGYQLFYLSSCHAKGWFLILIFFFKYTHTYTHTDRECGTRSLHENHLKNGFPIICMQLFFCIKRIQTSLHSDSKDSMILKIYAFFCPKFGAKILKSRSFFPYFSWNNAVMKWVIK